MSDKQSALVAGGIKLVTPFVVFIAWGLVLLTGMRIALLLSFRAMLGPSSELPMLFLTGLRFDLLLMSYLLAPAWFVACLIPNRFERLGRCVLKVYLVTLLAVMALLECAAWPALTEYGSRPEALFLEFLGYPREVISMVLDGFLVETTCALAALSLTAWWAKRKLHLTDSGPWPKTSLRLMLFPLGAGLLFLGARSSLQHRPANLSSAVFSQNHFHNELALNSTYTLLYAGYRRRHETETARDYGKLDLQRMQDLVRETSRIGSTEFRGVGFPPTLHRQQPLAVREGSSPNVVVILLESFGAEYTGRLGGTELTPNFDRLAAEGLAFDQLFATGTRTSRGIEAVLSGFFPSPARSVLKLGRSQHDFFTAAQLFGQAGYTTHFVYGGAANFDEMKSFFAGNGVQKIWDQPKLQKPRHAVGVWGIHDEDLFSEAHDLFERQGEKPFFALILSTSNHSPYDYPAGKIAIDPAYPADSVENAIKYTDYALGRFFEQAKASPYFENTLFLVVADHGTRVSGDQLIPVYKFHVPAMIVGPRRLVTPGAVRMLASQVDLMPTLLSLTGREWEHPMMGRNLLALSEEERGDETQGRALLQYETHFGYWSNGDMIILRPDLPPAQFTVEHTSQSGRFEYQLHPVATDPALAERALAHSLFPSWLYRERLYRLHGTGRLLPDS